MTSIITDDRQFVKSVVGPLRRNIPREEAFCAATVRNESGVVIPGLRADARFRDSPFVAGPPFVRFYTGVPLRGPGGWFVGSMCILDTERRSLGPRDCALLRRLAGEAELELNGIA